jgi:signal transduction histidine kinase
MAGAGLLAIAIFLVDLSGAASFAGGAVYLVPLLFGWWLARPVQIVGLAVLASALLIAGHLLNAADPLAPSGLLERGLVLLLLSAVAALLVAAKRRERAFTAESAAQAACLVAARTQARLASQGTSAFLSSLNHELRTPLNAIIGFSEMVGNEVLGPLGTERYRGYMCDINESGRHLLGLVTDLLDLAKIETGRVELREETVELDELLSGCLAELEARLKKAGIAVQRELRPGLPPLKADPKRLRQILTNLLSNAVAFTPEGGSLRVTAWCRPADGYVIQVSDTGIGIRLEDIPAALAPFGQVKGHDHAARKGAGLGLTLAKALTELHAGSLDLQSEPGKGTTATLRFPAERVVSLDKVA